MSLAIPIALIAFAGVLGIVTNGWPPPFTASVNGEPLTITPVDGLTFPEWDELPLDYLDWPFLIEPRPFDWARDRT